ncbi:MAG: nucleotide disphospho-sugar-binding domain-containing protein [Pseudomonadota bacterium]
MALPRILFAWEAGENFGHVSKIAEVARGLTGRAELLAAVRNPIALRQIAPDLPVTILPAPAAPPQVLMSGDDAGRSYPDVLRHAGWAALETLAPLVEAWRNLFALVQPDVLAVQAAPTALLAARGTGLRTAMIGSGFDAPPRAHPMPAFYHWDKDANTPPVTREAGVLEVANRVLAEVDAPTLSRFCDLLQTDAYLLATFAEIDHYGLRTVFEPDHPPYLGQLVTLDQGTEMTWRPQVRHRILAYLRPRTPPFEPAVRALARLDRSHDVILAAPGASNDLAERLQSTSIRLHSGPVRLDRLLPECDLGISHASNGVAAAFVMAGVPQLGLPGHAEQVMIAQTVARQKLGLGLVGQFGPDAVQNALETTLGSTAMRQRAQKTAGRLQQTLPADPGRVLADAVLALA